MKILLFVSLLFFTSFSSSENPPYREDVEKFIKGIWKQKDIQVENYTDESVTDLRIQVIKDGSGPLGFIVVNKVNTCREGGCSDPSTGYNGKYDYFYYVAAFNPHKEVMKIKVLNYHSERGYEICSRGWLKQFRGKKGCESVYGKNIDAISGATISGQALVDEIHYICEILPEPDSNQKN